MVVTFMGLTGPHGVLPRHYTQLLISRNREKDFTLRDFLDLFNHRAISLFYRAWEKYHFPVVYEATAAKTKRPGDDLFTRCLYSITGYGLPGLRDRLEADDETFLYYGGLFAARRPTEVSLQAILADILRLPTRVLQFQGQWLYLTRADRSSLPTSQQRHGHNNQLGTTLMLGRRVCDVQNKFRIRIGPLTYHDFRRFMPDGDQLARTCQLVRSYVGPGYDFDLQAVLLAEQVPQCCLGHAAGVPARLGWNTWLRAAPMPHDADDAVFSHSGTSNR
jgi:type VI secretion system protein ImpH